MENCCIVVADGARARFFRVQGGANPRLTEEESLVNPEHRIPGHELHPDPRSAAQGRVGVGARTYTLDDGRDAHREEVDRRFAVEIGLEGERWVRERGVHRIVLVAEPRALGRLRPAFDALKARATVDEVPHDLAGRTVPEITSYLREHAVIGRIAHA